MTEDVLYYTCNQKGYKKYLEDLTIRKDERVKMVKCMEFIARQINDEDVFEGWLINGVADGDIDYADTEGMDKSGATEYYIEDKEFAELMGCFLRVMSRARKSGGLWCDKVLSED